MRAEAIQMAKVAVAEMGVSRAINPPEDDRPFPDAYPGSADGEPIFEPVSGEPTIPTEIQPFETFDASPWEGGADRAQAMDCT